MLISDFKKKCTNCEGSGYQAGYDEWGSIQTNLSQSCPTCSGKGHNLTELGQDFWELYRPMIQDLICNVLQKKS